ncbi:E3 ubiquitin-protein ligase listerin [Aphelenchoides fujianensis]|nr:E3 ubiquitin-protein ligase listerin [Aphelenchoides fujianensis]
MGKDAKNRQKGGVSSIPSASIFELMAACSGRVQQPGGRIAAVERRRDSNSSRWAAIRPMPTSSSKWRAAGQSAEEFGDVEPEMRVAFRKLTKRESNTREKGLRTLIEAVERTTGDSAPTLNGIRHFVPFYQSLVLDGVSGVRVVANECLAAVITKFQKQAAEHIVKMLPYTLLSVHDHLAAVRKSATELLEKCFTEEQRKKVDERAAPKAVKICLEMIRRKHNSLNKQKFEDVETHGQRTERIVLQAITTLTKLQAFAEDKAEVVKTLDETHDVVSKISDQIHGNLLACVLALIKGGSVAEVMGSPLAMKVIRFLDSEKPLLYRNAFGCYMRVQAFIWPPN